MSFVKESAAVELKGELSRRMPQVLFEQWFAQAEIISWDGSRLEMGVQNRFFKSRIETNYLTLLKQAAEAAFGCPVEVSISVSPRLLAAFRKSQAEAQAQVEAEAEEYEAVFAAPPAAPKQRVVGLELNPDFTFDGFVVGGSNRLSHAVAMRAVDNPGEFNRIYFCGQHGVGKTRLLQAICHATRLRRPDAAIAYVTAEKFVADFTSAHAVGKLKEFRAAYRSLGLLAFDEFQALGQGNKAGTQAALLGIIDELEARGGQIVIAATHAPADLEGIDAKLRDRLCAAFVDKLSVPDYDARRELIVRKLAERRLSLPVDAVDLLAKELTGNVRKLEGTVVRLAALMQIEGMEPTTNCIRMAMEVSSSRAKPSALTYEDIVQAVADEYGLTREAVVGRGRAAKVRKARQLAIALCRHAVGGRYADIGAVFDNRSHATIISAMKNLPENMVSGGVESRPVERILFRLGVHVKPEAFFTRQKGLFE